MVILERFYHLVFYKVLMKQLYINHQNVAPLIHALEDIVNMG